MRRIECIKKPKYIHKYEITSKIKLIPQKIKFQNHLRYHIIIKKIQPC